MQLRGGHSDAPAAVGARGRGVRLVAYLYGNRLAAAADARIAGERLVLLQVFGIQRAVAKRRRDGRLGQIVNRDVYHAVRRGGGLPCGDGRGNGARAIRQRGQIRRRNDHAPVACAVEHGGVGFIIERDRDLRARPGHGGDTADLQRLRGVCRVEVVIGGENGN
ncbi:hypothetical protein BN135_1496 [Cronobacter muytjensii 530]